MVANCTYIFYAMKIIYWYVKLYFLNRAAAVFLRALHLWWNDPYSNSDKNTSVLASFFLGNSWVDFLKILGIDDKGGNWFNDVDHAAWYASVLLSRPILIICLRASLETLACFAYGKINNVMSSYRGRISWCLLSHNIHVFCTYPVHVNPCCCAVMVTLTLVTLCFVVVHFC